MMGLINYGKMIDEESEGTAYTFHITLVGDSESQEYAVYEYHDDGLIVARFGIVPAAKMFIPATAIKTIEVEYN